MRRQPYTERGIRRVPCTKCGKPSAFQWQICADGNVYRGLCAEHDVELNAMVMRWAFGETREDAIRRYAEKCRVGKQVA